MSYYGAGDYYGAGGLGSFFGRVARGAVGFVTGGPAGAAQQFFRGRPITRRTTPTAGRFSGVAIPRIGGSSRSAPQIQAPGAPRRKRRRMDYGNTKALKRAMRRQEGFVKVAKQALKGSNYKIVTKGSRSRSRATYTARDDIHIRN